MRYGKPSIASALAALDRAGIDRLVVLPLFPQYASSVTGLGGGGGRSGARPGGRSSAPRDPRRLLRRAGIRRGAGRLSPAPRSPTSAPTTCSSASTACPRTRSARAIGPGATASRSPIAAARPPRTSRAATAPSAFARRRACASPWALPREQTSSAFQSRLGPTPWIRPFTDEELAAAAPARREAARRLLSVLRRGLPRDPRRGRDPTARAVARARGEELWLAPCLNGDERFASAVADWIRRRVPAPRP